MCMAQQARESPHGQPQSQRHMFAHRDTGAHMCTHRDTQNIELCLPTQGHTGTQMCIHRGTGTYADVKHRQGHTENMCAHTGTVSFGLQTPTWDVWA